MGTYLYTMRKKRVPIMFKGELHQANMFSYAYKPSWSYVGPSYERMERLYETKAKAAFQLYDGGLVILGSGGLEGCQIYRNVRSCRWLDSGDFPGELAGFVHLSRKGRLYAMDRTKWRGQGEEEIRFTLNGYETRPRSSMDRATDF